MATSQVYSNICFELPCYGFLVSPKRRSFSFLPSSALWNAEPIPSGSAEKKTYFLCELCGLSEAGGEKYALTYQHSKAGTTSLAGGLRG